MCLPSFTLSPTRGTNYCGWWVTLRGSTNSFVHDVNAGRAALLLHLLIPSVLQSAKLQLILFFFPHQLLPLCFSSRQRKKNNRFAIPVQITCIYFLHISGFVSIYLGINIYGTTVALYCTTMEAIFDYIFFLRPICLTSVHMSINLLPALLPLDFYVGNQNLWEKLELFAIIVFLTWLLLNLSCIIECISFIMRSFTFVCIQ